MSCHKKWKWTKFDSGWQNTTEQTAVWVCARETVVGCSGQVVFEDFFLNLSRDEVLLSPGRVFQRVRAATPKTLRTRGPGMVCKGKGGWRGIEGQGHDVICRWEGGLWRHGPGFLPQSWRAMAGVWSFFFKMKEGGFGGRFDVRLEKERGILDDTKVADLRGLVDLAPICIKMEIFSLLE